jgi:hypothetical protein
VSCQQHRLATSLEATEQVAINAAIGERLASILDSAKTRRYFPDCPGSAFRKLPWAKDQDTRAPYIRQQASWRGVSVTWGSLPITNLEIINMRTAFISTSLNYFDVDVPASGLTFGACYSLLLSEHCHNGGVARWNLIIGKRLGAYDDLYALSREGSFINENQAMDVLVSDEHATQAAVLLVSCTVGPVHPPKIHCEGQWCHEK